MKNHAAEPGRSSSSASLPSLRPSIIALSILHAFPPQRLQPPKYRTPSELRHLAFRLSLNRLTLGASELAFKVPSASAGRLRGWLKWSLRLRARSMSGFRQVAAKLAGMGARRIAANGARGHEAGSERAQVIDSVARSIPPITAQPGQIRAVRGYGEGAQANRLTPQGRSRSSHPADQPQGRSPTQ